MPERREKLIRELAEESRKSTLDGVYFFQAVAERSGMNLTDMQCVAVLTQTGPITAGQLAEEMRLTTGAVTGVVDRMERAGYVRREKDPADGRRVIVRPVLEKLERAGANFFGSMEGEMDALLSEHDDEDLAVFLDLMRKANAMTEQQIAKIRAASERGEEDEYSAPLGSAERGRLVFANGTSRLAIRVASGTENLYRARFEGPAPRAETRDGTVTFRYRRRPGGLFDRRGSSADVALNPVVPWEVEVRGGASEVKADLGGLVLTSFVLKGGISDLDLTLPEPYGVVPVRLSGGSSKVSVRRPAGVEARMDLKGGASRLNFDEQSFDAVGGKVRLQSPGFDGAADRYEIEVSGGASEVTIR